MRRETVEIDRLESWPGNARRHADEVIRESVREHGQYRSVVVQAGSMRVLAGHGTVAALRDEGFATVEVDLLDVSDEQARRIVLVDNRSNDLAAYDDAALADLLAELGGDFEGTGFTPDDLGDLLSNLGVPGRANTDPGPVPESATTRLGDLYVLGAHRLLCGDAADPDDVTRLLGDDQPDLVVTDPPYGVKYESAGRTRRYDRSTGNYGPAGKQHRDIANDWIDMDGTAALVCDALSLSSLRRGGAFYVFGPTGPALQGFMAAIGEAYGPEALRQGLIWLKDSMVFGRSDYHYQHESILYGWVPGAAHHFVDDRTQTSIWECPRPTVSEEHPTMKPVELVERAIRNSSQPGEWVFDPFAGSGTAIVAAENVGRRALLMELDPGYCDVIVDRWERHTGGTAERITHDIEAHA